MPKKKPLIIPADFVQQVLDLIATESEIARKKMGGIAQEAKKLYNLPLQMWLVGRFFKYTRKRNDEIDQFIDVMEHCPNAYLRLDEFKQKIIEKGEWNVGSYNYDLFQGLIEAIPNYEPLDDKMLQRFIIQLRLDVSQQIDKFMTQYNKNLEQIKAREKERREAHQNNNPLLDNTLIFNDQAKAQEAQSAQQDKIIFSINFQNDQWQLTWVDASLKSNQLELSKELFQKLSTLVDYNVEHLSPVSLKGIKRECLKARDQYLARIHLIINPMLGKTSLELTNEELAAKGYVSTFVLRHKGEDTSLFWINSLGNATPISLKDYPQLDAWLATHKSPFSEADASLLKAILFQVNTKQTFSVTKMETMNRMISNVLIGKQIQRKEPEKPIEKLDIGLFHNVEQSLKNMLSIPAKTQTDAPGKLTRDRYDSLSQLTLFRNQHQNGEEEQGRNQVVNTMPH